MQPESYTNAEYFLNTVSEVSLSLTCDDEKDWCVLSVFIACPISEENKNIDITKERGEEVKDV